MWGLDVQEERRGIICTLDAFFRRPDSICCMPSYKGMLQKVQPRS